MGRDAVALVEEYSTNTNCVVRRNAVTAFAALRREAAFDRVVDMALRDEEPDVRKRAEDELTRALEDTETAPLAACVLDRRLDSQPASRDNTESLAVYCLLGKLPRGPLERHLRRRPMRERLSLVWNLARLKKELQQWGERARLVWGVALGNMVGLALLVGLIYASQRTPAQEVGEVFWALFVLQITCWFWPVTVRAVPSGAQYYHRETRLIETVKAALLGGFFGILVVLLRESADGSPDGSPMTTVVFATLASGAVRAGTYWGLGALDKHPAVSRWWSVSTGATTGILTLTLLTLLWGSEFRKELWMCFIPLAFGMANVFTRMESHASTPRRPRESRASRWAGGVLVGCLVVGALLVIAGGWRGTLMSPLEEITWDGGNQKDIPLFNRTVAVKVILPTAGILGADVESPDSGAFGEIEAEGEGCEFYAYRKWKCRHKADLSLKMPLKGVDSKKVFDVLANTAMQRFPSAGSLRLSFQPESAEIPPGSRPSH